MPRRTRGLRAARSLVVLVVIAALAGTTVVVHSQTSDVVLIGYWYLGALVISACVIAFLVGRRHVNRPVPEGRVLCVVPAYNEDPAGLHRTVVALLNQTIDLDVVVIDDGSAVPVVPSITHPRLTWLRHGNTGKRGAQVAVLRRYTRDDYEFILTVDSDSEPFHNACVHLLRAMSDPKVQAATGMIYIRNWDQSWVSMAADMDIGGSCVMMRASRSMLGALETTSGALALYRSDLLYDHLDAYAVECGTGDDRWLALRALRRGDVVGVAEAGVVTDMPTTLKGTYRQRLRWARSWWWMLPYVITNLSPKQLLSPVFGLIQLSLAPVLAVYMVFATVSSVGGRYTGSWWILGIYAATYVVVRFGVSALYVMGRPGLTRRQKWRLFSVGTLAAIALNVMLLAPTRYVALFKLFDNRWQTREAPPVPTSTPTSPVRPIPGSVLGW